MHKKCMRGSTHPSLRQHSQRPQRELGREHLVLPERPHQRRVQLAQHHLAEVGLGAEDERQQRGHDGALQRQARQAAREEVGDVVGVEAQVADLGGGGGKG